ncbi:hypothetical protein IV54_GL000137 [Levilactobacillus paucivorans]|uniref:Uncharacterized protein n=1 Tax=Levilactobacillus paucivorans TaxID=616990 RepID=A0A0R2LTK1_9LACO|nr:hypothetical protein IV54_GL000137 [Levilactobacillus paucivorans]
MAVIVAVESFFHKAHQIICGTSDSESLHLRNPVGTKIAQKGEGECRAADYLIYETDFMSL